METFIIYTIYRLHKRDGSLEPVGLQQAKNKKEAFEQFKKSLYYIRHNKEHVYFALDQDYIKQQRLK